MNQVEMLQIVEHYCRKTEQSGSPLTVTRVADSKTTYVETVGGVGRSIYMTEFKVDGKIIWAGYSTRSAIVYVSETSRS